MYRPQSISEFSGFTLLELIIVVGIVGLMAVLAVPWFMKISQRGKVMSAAREIHTTLVAARMRAVRRNLSTSVLIVTAPPAEAQHRLDTIEGDTPPTTPTPSPVSRYFIAKNAIEFVSLPAGGGKITFAGDGRMITPAAPPFPTPPLSNIVVQGVGSSAALGEVTIQTLASGRVWIFTPTPTATP